MTSLASPGRSVTRPQRDQAGNRPQGCQMLYGLMGRAVFAVAHGVVCEEKEGRELHQRREPDRWTRVVAEDEEGRAERAELRQGEPVHNGGHRMLADAEMQVFPCRALGREVSRALVRQRRLVRGAKIR